MPLKVLIAEELPALRQHARTMLHRALYSKGPITAIEADNGTDALQLFEEQHPQLVIMNTVLPGMSGLKLAEHIFEQSAGTTVLFWINKHRQLHIREIKRLLRNQTVDGYILQSASDERFCRALESIVIFNNPFLDPDLRSTALSFDPSDAVLTKLEQETLGDLLLGLTDKAIARKRHLTVRGVQNRLSSLATKLLGRDRCQLESGIEFYNLRVRMIFEALKLGVYTVEDIPALEKDLTCWMENSAPQSPLLGLSR